MLELIRQHLRTAPSKPFEIRCSSREVFRVGHPGNAAVIRNTVVVALNGSDNVINFTPLHLIGVAGADSVAA